MAQVMSFISVVFILAPVIAPSFGQAILLVADWRAIFAVLAALGLMRWAEGRRTSLRPGPQPVA